MAEVNVLPTPTKVDFPTRLAHTRYGWMFYVPTDIYVGRSIAEYGEYSYIEAEALRLLTAHQTMIDVGANQGAHTIAVLHSTAQVLAIEPQPLLAKLIDCSGVAGGFESRAYEVVNGLCGAEPAEYQRNSPNYVAEMNYGCFGRGNGLMEGKGLRAYTVDELVATYNIPNCTVIKIDVEGMEVDVLRGATSLLRTQHPYIMVEADREDHLPELLRVLEEHDYRAYWFINMLYYEHNYYANPTNVFGGECSINILGVPPGRPDIPGLVPALPTHRIADPDSGLRIVTDIGPTCLSSSTNKPA